MNDIQILGLFTKTERTRHLGQPNEIIRSGTSRVFRGFCTYRQKANPRVGLWKGSQRPYLIIDTSRNI